MYIIYIYISIPNAKNLEVSPNDVNSSMYNFHINFLHKIRQV